MLSPGKTGAEVQLQTAAVFWLLWLQNSISACIVTCLRDIARGIWVYITSNTDFDLKDNYILTFLVNCHGHGPTSVVKPTPIVIWCNICSTQSWNSDVVVVVDTVPCQTVRTISHIKSIDSIGKILSFAGDITLRLVCQRGSSISSGRVE